LERGLEKISQTLEAMGMPNETISIFIELFQTATTRYLIGYLFTTESSLVASSKRLTKWQKSLSLV